MKSSDCEPPERTTGNGSNEKLKFLTDAKPSIRTVSPL